MGDLAPYGVNGREAWGAILMWTRVYERKRGQLTGRWKWMDVYGVYENKFYPGAWLKPTAICPPPNMGVARDAPKELQR